VVEHEQAERRRQIALLAVGVDPPISSDSIMPRPFEISFMLFQNAASRLTLVLWPPTTTDRFTTGDFTGRLLRLSPHHLRRLACGKLILSP
jgi:hypothetical protein